VNGNLYPAGLDFEGPLEVQNWRALVNWLLAIPHLLIAYGLQQLRRVLLLISFFAVLFTKAIPKSLFDVMVMTYRYGWRASTYALFMRNSYPPFNFNMTPADDGIDPASLSVDYPTELNRWLPLVKWLLAIPHYIVLIFLYIGVIVVYIIAFFAVLFTGRFPAGMRSFVVKTSAWKLRVSAYAGLLRDEYPPFALNVSGPGAGTGAMGGPPLAAPPTPTELPPPPPPPPPDAGA
jgi:Domain of unknown function (DUF4389)